MSKPGALDDVESGEAMQLTEPPAKKSSRKVSGPCCARACAAEAAALFPGKHCVCAHVCVCACACVRVCVCACVRACVRVSGSGVGIFGAVWLTAPTSPVRDVSEPKEEEDAGSAKQEVKAETEATGAGSHYRYMSFCCTPSHFSRPFNRPVEGASAE